jgi:hypothetical protein
MPSLSEDLPAAVVSLASLPGGEMKRHLDWALHAGGGFVIGFYGGLTALTIWIIYLAKRQEIRDRRATR